VEKWKKPSLELGILLESALKSFDCQKKTMFGAPVFTVNHNMFAGIHGDNIFVRLSEADRKKIATLSALPFEPMPGHVMKEYMVLSESLYRDPKAPQEWLKRAYDYVATLAPKEPKRRAAKKIKS
jgi:TfoX/Sxy family transcriptional regulator of competence genes